VEKRHENGVGFEKRSKNGAQNEVEAGKKAENWLTLPANAD
jgi:hypothetical protein